MEITNSKTISLLCPHTYTTTTGGVENRDNLDYTDKEIRTALKNLSELPSSTDICIDLNRVYDYLGKEWQDVFNMYVLGVPLVGIAEYWVSLHNETKSIKVKRNYGNKLVTKLIARIQFFLRTYVRRFDFPQLRDCGKLTTI